MPTLIAKYSSLRLHDHFRVPKELELKLNDMVVLRTRRGEELGQVKQLAGEHRLSPSDIIAGEVLRRVTHEDSARYREFRFGDFRHVKRAFRELAATHKLPMQYASCEKLLSGDKLIVYFQSEDRVDFRDFVRDFTERMQAKVDLRQVGARDAAKVSGDVGACGQELCCISYLLDFVPVSMKMAKNQRISLDPAKISGQCGRLKCCLKYEDDLYVKLKQTVPMEGQPVTCEGKECHACGVDILGQKVTVDFGDGRREQREVAEIQFEAGWTDKDIRRYKRERRAKFIAEKEAREAARSERMKAAGERRFGQDAVHPGRRTSDQPRPAAEDSGRLPPVPEADGEPAEAADDGTSLQPVDEGAVMAPAESLRLEAAPAADVAQPAAPEAERADDGEEDDEEDEPPPAAGSGAMPAADPNRPRRRRRRRGRRRSPGGGQGGSQGGSPSAGPAAPPPASS